MQGEHKNVIALDLQNANLQHHHQNIDKVASKMSIPVRPIQLTQQTSNNVEHQQSSQAPRKTIIQVSLEMIKFLQFFDSF
jgi:hypothetical protein